MTFNNRISCELLDGIGNFELEKIWRPFFYNINLETCIVSGQATGKSCLQ